MNTVFLGIIAVAVPVMAVIQVAAVVFAARAAAKVDRLTEKLEHDLQPVFSNLQTMTSDAARAVSLATGQVERLDKLVTDISARVEQTVTLLQEKVAAPVKEGAALLAGLRAALLAFRELRDTGRSGPSPVDEEDPLFIG